MACTGHPYVKSVTTITMRSIGLRKPSNIVPRRATLGVFAGLTAVALPFTIMNDDVALFFLASCRTRLIRATLVRRVHRLCQCLHMLQYANGCLFFQPLLPFSPDSGVLPKLPLLFYSSSIHVLPVLPVLDTANQSLSLWALSIGAYSSKKTLSSA